MGGGASGCCGVAKETAKRWEKGRGGPGDNGAD